MQTIIKTYPNGLRLAVTPMPNFKSVAFSMLIMAGSGDETKQEEGLSHFCEHMLFKGTTHRTGQQIIEEFAHLGVHYNAWTSESATCYHTKAVADNLDACLSLFSDMYFFANSLFPIPATPHIKRGDPVSSFSEHSFNSDSLPIKVSPGFGTRVFTMWSDRSGDLR